MTKIKIEILVLCFLFGCQNEKSKLIEVFDHEGNLLNSFYEDQNGLKYGQYIYYYPNGGIQSITNMQLGKKQGKEKIYYPSGNLKSVVEFRKGKKSGRFNFYYDKENRFKQKGTYDNDILVDSFFVYYPNQILKLQAFYKEGKKIGLLKTYFENGFLEYIRMHSKDNKLFYKANFDTLGKCQEVEGDGILLKTNTHLLTPIDSTLYYEVELGYLPSFDNFLYVSFLQENDTLFSETIKVTSDVHKGQFSANKQGDYSIYLKLYHKKINQTQISVDTSFMISYFYFRQKNQEKNLKDSLWNEQGKLLNTSNKIDQKSKTDFDRAIKHLIN